MADKIRTVTVELLRKGTPHNQLLSPLTEYLGICGGSGAGQVTIPYEQAGFNHQLAQLRYPDDDEQDQAPRQLALRSFGRELGEVLGQIPGLTGTLTQLRMNGERCLVNLRLVSSASELSMLPFELAKVPTGTGKPTDEWLALQAGIAVCITRRFRSVEPCSSSWPVGRPRVLFIVGLHVADSLIDEHRRILREALKPWWSRKEEKGTDAERGEARGEDEPPGLVEILKEKANVQEITRRLAEGFPYVHILAHGAESPATEGAAYGLLLAGQGQDEVDVLTGDRFSSILCSLPCEVPRPSMIVTASCDSATQADVLVPGGSFAQALHLAGVPLVVGSQFPLTTRGSASLARSIYGEVFWGNHPLEILARARARLHAEDAYSHDWASLVVYDALPREMSLEEVRYQRAKATFQRAQRDLRRPRARALAERALAELPGDTAYARECEGLRASYAKQLAEIAYEGERYREARRLYFEARRLYRDSASRFLDPGSEVQRHATLHWVQIQALALDRILGQPADPWARWVAYRSAELELKAQQGGQPYWAHGSLAELFLLKLFEEDLGDEERKETVENAKQHTRAILQYAGDDPFPVFSTRRQMNRYVAPWGDPEFSKKLKLDRSSAWEGDPGVRQVARELVEILSRQE